MCIDVVLSLFSSEEKVSRSGRIIKPKKRFIEEVEEEKQHDSRGHRSIIDKRIYIYTSR